MATCYRAKQISTSKWLQRLDWNPSLTDAEFKTHVAAQFTLAESDVNVVTADWTAARRDTAVAELAAGAHEGLAVVTAPKPAAAPIGRVFLKEGVVPNITGATTAAKLDRIAALCVLDPAFAMCINICNIYESLTGGDVTFLRKCWGRKLAVGGLSAGEVTAIEAAAPTYGITLP